MVVRGVKPALPPLLPPLLLLPLWGVGLPLWGVGEACCPCCPRVERMMVMPPLFWLDTPPLLLEAPPLFWLAV